MRTHADIKEAYSIYNKIELVKGGSSYFSLLEKLIENSEHSIYIRMYIWEEDATGTRIAGQLIGAARRNVAVYVVADGYASGGLSKGFIKNLEDNGVHFRFFEPLLKCSHFYFGRRMHEKIVVTDGLHALVGGINFADRYNDVPGTAAWLDYAVYLEGQTAYKLYRYCSSGFAGKEGASTGSPGCDIKGYNCSVRICRNDWVKRKHEIWRTYFNWFNMAEQSITIMCSYFLPGRVLKKQLSKAADRGVNIKVILAGTSDILLAKHAERYLYRWMLRKGIGIYEYQPSVLHAKMMVIDNRRVTIGSFNVNDVSTFASMELNLDIRNRPFASSVQKTMDAIMERDCIRITEENFLPHTTLFRRLLQWCCYQVIRIILKLSTFYFKFE